MTARVSKPATKVLASYKDQHVHPVAGKLGPAKTLLQLIILKYPTSQLEVYITKGR